MLFREKSSNHTVRVSLCVCLTNGLFASKHIKRNVRGQDLPKLQCWMKGKDLSNGGPLTTYGSEVDSTPADAFADAGPVDQVKGTS